MGTQKLHHGTENVCLGYHDERNLYAVGSRSHTTVLDARSLQPIQNKNIASPYPTCGTKKCSASEKTFYAINLIFYFGVQAFDLSASVGIF